MTKNTASVQLNYLSRRFLLPLTVLLCLVAVELSGLAASIVPQRPCRLDCQISLVPVTTITATVAQKSSMPLDPVLVAPFGSDAFAVVARSKKELLVSNRFGQVNQVIGTIAGRQFGFITGILPLADGTVEVFDIQNRTLTRLASAANPLAVRTARYQPSLMLDEKRYIHLGNIRTPELVGQPVHLLGLDGAVVTSFGAHSAVFREDRPLASERVVGRGQADTIWVAAATRYVLEHWDPNVPRELERIEVPSTWFREPVGELGPADRPRSVVQAIWEVDGYLWVLLSDADLKWAPPPPRVPEEKQEPKKERIGLSDPQEDNRRADWILEVVDPKERRVVASRRFDRAVWARGSSFLFASRGVRGAWNEAALELWRPMLSAKRR